MATKKELELENARLRGQVEALEKIVEAYRAMLERAHVANADDAVPTTWPAPQIPPLVPSIVAPVHAAGCSCSICLLQRVPQVLPTTWPNTAPPWPVVMPPSLPTWPRTDHGGNCACPQCCPAITCMTKPSLDAIAGYGPPPCPAYPWGSLAQ